MTDDNFEALQVPEEHDWLRGFYWSREPRDVLEIGVWTGGTLRTWLASKSEVRVVAVDLNHLNASVYGQWMSNTSTLLTIYGDSTSESVRRAIWVNGPYDFIFIDGDHGYNVVKEDVAHSLSVLRKGGVVVLHDIVDADGEVYGPGLVLNEYEARDYRVDRMVAQGQGSPHGLGVIYKGQRE